MEKIKRLINCPISVTSCNFRCKYCYVGQTSGFKGEIPVVKYSPEFIAHAMRKERLGGACMFNFCAAGETLLAPYLIDLTKLLLKDGHYVTIVTNGSLSKKFDELCEIPKELSKHLFVKFSFHYLELKRLNLFDTFFGNVKKIKEHGLSFTIELTANDDSVKHIQDIKNICKERLGALCHIIESRNDNDYKLSRLTSLDETEHLKNWESFNTPLISFQKTTWGIKRKEFCYAGDWIVNFKLDTGEIHPCLKLGRLITNAYDDLEAPINFAAIGTNCPWAHCFSSYFLLTNGVIPEMNTPCYSHLRNRLCDDGSEWLNQDVKTFMSGKLLYNNELYSEDKKSYIDAFMALVYKNKQNKYSKKQIAKIIEEALKSKSYKNILLYGFNKQNRWLLKLLKKTNIKVIGFVCDKKQTSSRTIKYILAEFWKKLYYKTNFFIVNDALPKVDCIIVGDYTKFDIHKNRLLNCIPNTDILSVLNIVNSTLPIEQEQTHCFTCPKTKDCTIKTEIN